MSKLNIVYVDDQREILTTLSKDLQIFTDYVNIEECESAVEALEIIDEIDAEGGMIAIIISDHIMPEMSGVEFLSKIQHDSRFVETRKILLTGQATHQDTIQAINEAKIERYIEKPWNTKQIQDIVKKELTNYLFEQGVEYQKYMPVLDNETLLKRISKM